MGKIYVTATDKLMSGWGLAFFKSFFYDGLLGVADIYYILEIF